MPRLATGTAVATAEASTEARVEGVAQRARAIRALTLATGAMEAMGATAAKATTSDWYSTESLQGSAQGPFRWARRVAGSVPLA